ncbi:hypothetical protein JW835_01050 [bacterium]|nr:hypothetical protein [bacterium]
MSDQKQQVEQLSLLEDEVPLCHFFDKNGALRTGRIVRKYTRGKWKGRFLVEDLNGKHCVPDKIRNIEIK